MKETLDGVFSDASSFASGADVNLNSELAIYTNGNLAIGNSEK